VEDALLAELEGQTSIEDALADAGLPWTPPTSPETAVQLVLF
jgi:hypothetical protein